jgi:hypothetical protein
MTPPVHIPDRKTPAAGAKASSDESTSPSRNTGLIEGLRILPHRVLSTCGLLLCALFAGNETGGSLTLSPSRQDGPTDPFGWLLDHLTPVILGTFLTLFVTISMIGSCK